MPRLDSSRKVTFYFLEPAQPHLELVEVPEATTWASSSPLKGTTEIMYQSIASAEKDVLAAAKDIAGQRTFLYIEVEKLDPIVAALTGVDIVLPLRTTFYRAKKIGVKDPTDKWSSSLRWRQRLNTKKTAIAQVWTEIA